MKPLSDKRSELLLAYLAAWAVDRIVTVIHQSIPGRGGAAVLPYDQIIEQACVLIEEFEDKRSEY